MGLRESKTPSAEDAGPILRSMELEHNRVQKGTASTTTMLTHTVVSGLIGMICWETMSLLTLHLLPMEVFLFQMSAASEPISSWMHVSDLEATYFSLDVKAQLRRAFLAHLLGNSIPKKDFSKRATFQQQPILSFSRRLSRLRLINGWEALMVHLLGRQWQFSLMI